MQEREAGTQVSSPNRIAACTMVKDEADIIESFARHALLLADVLLVADHCSTDGTLEILRRLQEEGLPLEIEEVREPEFRQSLVMTRLLHKAVKERAADLVLLLDADEFLLSPRTDAAGLRQYLQKLPLLTEGASYGVAWRNYEPEDMEAGREEFLLARPCRRAREYQVWQKIIACRGAVTEWGLGVVEGNHALFRPEGDEAESDYSQSRLPVVSLPPEEILCAHFPYRSREQFLRKCCSQWLAHAAKGPMGLTYAQPYQRALQQYLAGRPVDWEHPESEAADLAAYAGECRLRYTDGRVDVLAAVLQMAEQLALELRRERLRQAAPRISVILVCDPRLCALWGGIELEKWLLRALESLEAQDWPAAQVLILAEKSKLEGLRRELAGLAGGRDWVLASLAMADKLPQLVHGDYVQWLLPGDELQPRVWERLLLLLQPNAQGTFAFGCIEPLEPLPVQPGRRDTCALPSGPLSGDLPQMMFSLLWAQGWLLKTGNMRQFTISSGLIRRDALDKAGWLADFVRQGRLRPMTALLALFHGSEESAGVFSVQPYLRAPALCSLAEGEAYMRAWRGNLEFYRGTAVLSEEDYREARRQAEAALADLAAAASVPARSGMDEAGH